jgi:cytidine deaminase
MEGTEADKPCAPCGVCRQVMNEFCDPDTFEIILADGKGGELVFTLKEMLPSVVGGIQFQAEA